MGGLNAAQVNVTFPQTSGRVRVALTGAPGPQGPAGAGATDATTGAKGSVQLAGDLAGIAAAPTVPALANKLNTADFNATLDSRVGGDSANLAVTVAGKVSKGQLVLHVADYGAVGDGTTDDTSAIQTALGAARGAKARLRFDYGKTYIVSATLNPLGVHIEGFGATLKIKSGTTPTYAVLQSTGALTITDLAIDLNKSGTTNPGTDTQGLGLYVFGTAGWAGRVVLRDVTVINGHQIGVRFATGSTATDSLNVPDARALVDGLTVDGCKWGIWVKGCRGVTLVNPQISGSSSDGIYDYLSRDTQVFGGMSSGNTGHGLVTQYGYGTAVHGLSAFTNGGDGIVVGGGSTTITQGRYFSLIGNKVRGNTLHGIAVDPTKTGASAAVVPSYGVVSDNTAIGNTIHGINVTNGQYLAINGNVCTGNVASGIGVAGHSIALSGNVCTGNDRGIALYGNASFPNYGSHRIGMNVVTPNTTSTYYKESASVTGVQFATYTTTAPE